MQHNPALSSVLATASTSSHVHAGHEGPVFSVCPHVKGNISFVFSTGRDGRIKAWLYDSQVAAVVDYSAPGCSSVIASGLLGHGLPLRWKSYDPFCSSILCTGCWV